MNKRKSSCLSKINSFIGWPRKSQRPLFCGLFPLGNWKRMIFVNLCSYFNLLSCFKRMLSMKLLFSYIGLSKAMTAYIRDRFRYIDNSDIGSPASQTIHSILRIQLLVNELITTFQKKDLFINDAKIYENTNIQACITLPLLASFNFLNLCLNVKRQQFLCSASWEPFFVVISADMSKILHYCEFLLASLKEMVQSNDTKVSSDIHYLSDILKRWKVGSCLFVCFIFIQS